MTPAEFILLKEKTLDALTILRTFRLGESAASILLLALVEGEFTYTKAITIMHSDAATNAIKRLRVNGYIYREHRSDKRFKVYNLTASGILAATELSTSLEVV